jgi:1-acyl-sn-glycerol-3-phosphate acyltransferase
MLDFSDKPYQFFPPLSNRLVIALAKAFNRRFVLPGHKHRITNIELRNADRVAPLIRSQARCLFLPNHSTHSDPQLMLEVQRQLRVNSAIMAAYDVFLRSKRQAWLMQHLGCFSVDREGSDAQAMKCAVDILIKGDQALTIFAEGNVVMMNDIVTPFLGGAAFIGMRAQKKLGPDKPVYAIPVSMKFSHLADVREDVINHVVDLEGKLGIKPSDDQTIRRRLRQLGLQILTRNLRQRGYLPPASEDHDEDLNQLLEASAVQIISKLEEKIELTASPGDLAMDRIRRVRTAIHQTRIDESKQLDHRVAATWADEAILAMRILSYSGDYLRASPTLDRYSETLEMLREDLIEEFIPPIGDRIAIVQLGEPINLADQLEALSNNSRQTLTNLTQQFEQAVQLGLDDVGATLETPGVATL